MYWCKDKSPGTDYQFFDILKKTFSKNITNTCKSFGESPGWWDVRNKFPECIDKSKHGGKSLFNSFRLDCLNKVMESTRWCLKGTRTNKMICS